MSTTTITAGKINFQLNLGATPKAPPRAPDAPLHVLIAGDFTRQPQVAFKPRPIDCDNFDEVIQSLNPKLRIAIGGSSLDLSFSILDDFHPDRLLPVLEPWLRAEGTQALAPAAESSHDLLGRLMGPRPEQPPEAPGAGQALNALIRAAVGTSSVPAPSAGDLAARSVRDLDRASGLRTILHHPEFQALEANWRGLDLLVRSYGGEENVRLSLLDCSMGNLCQDLTAHEELQSCQLFRMLRRRDADERISLILGLYTFSPSGDDMDVLARVGRICGNQAATFVAGASPRFIGRDVLADTVEFSVLPVNTQEVWSRLRGLPEANRIGLALPRFLLRQPYGNAVDPIETFGFEEFAGDATHENFLWGNPALACGCVLADAFVADGWRARITGFGEVSDLPVYRFKQHGEMRVKPCAEAWMPETVAEQIAGLGLIPVSSIKGRDAVRVGVRSISGVHPALSLG